VNLEIGDRIQGSARAGDRGFWAVRKMPLLCGVVLLFSAATGGQVPEAKPDLTVSLRSTELLKPHQNITITVTVKNGGAGPAPRSECRVLIKNAHAPRQTMRTIRKNVRALGAGDEYAFSFSVKLGLGMFEITAKTDWKDKIAESDETNNEARIVIAGK
jgi:subtilase family serine protease